MIDDVTRRILAREGNLLSRPLFDGIESAVAQTTSALRKLSERDYPHLFASSKRAYFREALLGTGLPSGWTVTGSPKMNGQIILMHADLGTTLRVLAESRVTTNGVPHAGRTLAQQDAWTAVQVPLFTLPSDVRIDRRFLLLGAFESLEPSLRIVRPVAPGRYRGTVPCDYNLVLQQAAESWEDRSFGGSDEEEDLFTVRISEEESGSRDV
ncbi:hypothetical protein [Rathayibacter sp. AY1A4]|uniref:hypothetical protein n=1 Tax=Rathayibacter sp. AY1A4 TaxID=2080522 RepID=UPI0011B06B4E|nr:hypothetical protein [Rathayibacter sp. AY1A4]